ncbi:hypothetical protein VIBNIENn2_990159 [Vibrio nigripulchritudo ENn2]|nr:hypothetical protein VIBNIENn2_990159 [Vibrio nigripulchritudo ENn2]
MQGVSGLFKTVIFVHTMKSSEPLLFYLINHLLSQFIGF